MNERNRRRSSPLDGLRQSAKEIEKKALAEGEKLMEHRQRRPRRQGVTVGKVLGTILLVGLTTVLIFTGIFMTWVNSALKGHTEVYIDEFETKVSTELYYQDAATDEWVMYQTLFTEGKDRIWVSLDNIPKYLQDAAVAIEDKRFFRHNGVDFRSTVRAIVSTLTGGGVQGGSTITQQLVKNVTGDKETTVKRKVTEIYRAIEMEKRYEKPEILEAYLNEIYMGQSCYGVESASLRYFDKHVSELDLAQCAALISVTNNPSMFGPFESEWSREQNRSRQLLVLDAMLDQGKINQAEHDAAVAEEVIFANGYSNLGVYHGTDGTVTDAQTEEDKKAEEAEATPAVSKAWNSYFTDAVIEDVAAALMKEYGYDYKTAINKVYGGGYKIYTTQNYEYQKIAESVFEDVSNTPYHTGGGEQLQGAMTVMDPYTGYVIAMVGGVGVKTTDRGWNWATEPRPCGSSTKPISVYAPALDSGVITAASVIDDYPLLLLNTEGDNSEGNPYPKDDYSGFYGLTYLRRAIAKSMNCVAFRVCDKLGVWNSYDFMTSRLGFTTLTATDSQQLGNMALGGYSVGVTTEEMAAAYCTFPNEGIYTTPRTFVRVEDSNGKVILENTMQAHAAMKSSTAALMNSLLTDVVTSGTGTGAYFSGMTLAGKTGTTNNMRDRYFVGYSPYYVAACWVGYESNSKISSGGVNPAVALWKKVMSQIHEGLENKSFFHSSDLVQVTVCADSGMLATSACENDSRGSRVRTEWVAADNQPQEVCNLHTGGGVLNYYRDYFVNFPDVLAEDSNMVQLGNPIGTPGGLTDEFWQGLLGGQTQQPEDDTTQPDGTGGGGATEPPSSDQTVPGFDDFIH